MRVPSQAKDGSAGELSHRVHVLQQALAVRGRGARGARRVSRRLAAAAAPRALKRHASRRGAPASRAPARASHAAAQERDAELVEVKVRSHATRDATRCSA